jgi:hypothetical protein
MVPIVYVCVLLVVLVVFGSSTVAFGPQSSVPRRNQFVVVAAATKAENPLTATDLTEEQVCRCFHKWSWMLRLRLLFSRTNLPLNEFPRSPVFRNILHW